MSDSIKDDGGTTNGGTDISTARQFEVTVDNRAPSITGFSASNPSGPAVSVSFESDEQLATIDVSISGGGLTLIEGDFSETDNGDGTYTYVATDSGFGEGDYTATLNTAADDAGIGSGSSASDTVVVTTDDDSSSTPTQTPTPTGLSDGTDDTPTEDQRQPNGETNANEEFVEPSEIEAVEIVDVWLETAPANSVNTTSIVRLDNPSTADQSVDVRFVIDGAVVEERTVVVPAGEQINATHSEIVEEAGTHEVAANVATTADDGGTVRTFDFAVGVVELDEDGTEIASSSADPPSDPADASTGENQNDQAPASQEFGDGGVGGPATLLGLVAIVAVVLGALSWRRHTG